MTITWSVPVSTKQASLATPSPSRSARATLAPTEEIHAEIRWRLGFTGRTGRGAVAWAGTGNCAAEKRKRAEATSLRGAQGEAQTRDTRRCGGRIFEADEVSLRFCGDAGL